MDKVYLVSSGSYSDYSVGGVFSPEEKAQAWIDVQGCPAEYSIETRVFDPDADVVSADLRPYSLHIQRDGTAYGVELLAMNKIPHGPASYNIWHYNGNYQSVMTVTCWARNREHAIKIANEQRTMAIVAGKFDK